MDENSRPSWTLNSFESHQASRISFLQSQIRSNIMVRSHRHPTIRHAQSLLSGATRDLLPGEVRLFSYYRPSLQGGLHGIHVSQSIDAPPENDGQPRRTPTDGNGIPDDD